MTSPVPLTTKAMQREMEHQPTRIYAEEISEVVSSLGPVATALEIGAAWGVSTIAIASKENVAWLTSVDSNPCPSAANEIEENGLDSKWEFRLQRSEAFWKENKRQYDLIMVDGDHGYAGATLDLTEAWKVLVTGGTLIADDYRHDHNKDGDYGVSLAVLNLLSTTPSTVTYFGEKIIAIRKEA